MKLSTRMRYGTRAMLDIAAHGESGPVSLAAVAERQEISAKYLEALLTSLRAAGLVRSIRGAQGGYLLAERSDVVNLRQVFEALEGTEGYASCTRERDACTRSSTCATQEVWARMYEASMQVLEATTIADLARRSNQLAAKSETYSI
ncbi:MAG: RrF2 family transcriptional regulator [Anaerolineae bacterium]